MNNPALMSVSDSWSRFETVLRPFPSYPFVLRGSFYSTPFGIDLDDFPLRLPYGLETLQHQADRSLNPD
jgi:hypothetical protein